MGKLIRLKEESIEEAADEFMTRVCDELGADEAVVIARKNGVGAMVRHFGDELALLGLLDITGGLLMSGWLEESSEAAET